MMGARHEMPGKSAEMIRPVGNCMIDGRGRRFVLNGGRSVARPDHTVPRGTGLSMPLFPGISCLATIIPSLRDNIFAS
jgi:hypothetical protein